MEQDIELKTMGIIYDSLKTLDAETQNRVINWVKSKLSLNQVATSQIAATQVSTFPTKALTVGPDITAFESAAELISLAPETRDIDKVLIVSAFIQEKFGKTELVGREIQAELHNLGFRVANITSTIGALSKRKPQLMIQVRKEGKSQQAQKKYRVTVAGLNTVKTILAPSNITET